MGKIVFMFPGQGAQYVGMGKDFYDSFACSKEIFDKANEVLDIDVKNAQGILVVNVGFHTTEISILSLGGIVLSKLIKLGGKKMAKAL